MRIILLVIALLLLMGGIAVAKEADYQLWPVSSLVKVMPEGPLPNPPRSGEAAGVSLSAARGERESAQVVITAGSGALKAVEVGCSDLTGPRGASIPASRIELLRVAYIDLPNLKQIAPDPLPPATPFEVPAGKNQPVWITVSVPRDAQPGQYSGQIVVKPEGGPERRLPVSLKVWNFALPAGPSSKTAFGLSDGWVAQQHGVKPGSPQGKRLAARYYEMLVDRWVSPYNLPVPVTSDQAARYINDPRCTSYTIPYSDDVEQMRKSVESLRSRGLLSKGYFYPIDEPVNADAYKRLVEVCTKIHQVDPKLRIVIPYFRDPDYEAGGKTIHELADGHVNIWCPNIEYFNAHKDRLYAKLAKGEEFWWYVCCGPGAPYPNYFLNMDGPSHRVIPWMEWKYRCQGLLYWNTTWWNPADGTADPWEDMATVKGINKDLYGDGSLLYPGKKVGMDGPVSSIRLELLREGLEDYEYLVLLEKKIGRSAAEKLVSRLVTSPNDFSRDIAKWAKVREAIGEELSR